MKLKKKNIYVCVCVHLQCITMLFPFSAIYGHETPICTFKCLHCKSTICLFSCFCRKYKNFDYFSLSPNSSFDFCLNIYCIPQRVCFLNYKHFYQLLLNVFCHYSYVYRFTYTYINITGTKPC